jgi:hypothetical protein
VLAGNEVERVGLRWANPLASDRIFWELGTDRVLFMFTGAAMKKLAEQFYESCYHNADWIRAITKRGKKPHDYLEGMPW